MAERPSTAESEGASDSGPAAVNPADLEGRWEGVNSIPGLGEMSFVVTLAVSDGGLRGTIDIPAQGAFGLELSSVVLESGFLRIELETPVGLAVWEGEAGERGVEGVFTQAGLEGTFRLQPSGDEATSPAGDGGDPRFRREEVVFSNGPIVLTGELTFPEGAGPHPGVVLISGSGPQDRASNLFGFRIFAALADHLAEVGVASLRFDDRGVRGSTGDTLQATVQDRAGDVEAAVGVLLSREDIDGGSIGLIGHSEGGLVAPMVANRTESISFLVLLAAPALPGGNLLLVQVRTILEMDGTAEEEIEQALAQQRLVHLAATTRQGWNEVEASLHASAREQLEALPQEAREAISDEQAYVNAIVTQQLASARSPWFRSLVDYDPRPAVVALDVPVLALYGGLDIQVSAHINSAAFLEAAAESNIPDHTLVTIPAANHSFQEALTGHVTEFAQLKPEFAPDFLETLLTWLAEQVSSQ